MINDDEVVEPYIGEENNKKTLFGFVDMEGAGASEDSSSPILLKLQCPNECTQDLRIWICTKCGDYIRTVVNVIGWQLLICNCGLKRYKESLFICNHSYHPLESEAQLQTNSSTQNPIPHTEVRHYENLSNDNIISLIYQKLRKIKEEKGTDAGPKLLIALADLPISGNNKEGIRNILRPLQSEQTIDTDTQHLIDLYMNNDK